MEMFERPKRVRKKKARVDKLFFSQRSKKPIYKENPRWEKVRIVSENNYLKNYLFVRDYILFKYKLKERELMFFMFLYNEPIFDVKKMQQFCQTTLTTKHMFDKLVKNGDITVWYDPNAKGKGKNVQYELSQRTKKICASMYSYLNFEDKILTSESMRAFMKLRKGNYFYKKYIDQMEESKHIQSRSKIYITNFKKK